MEDFIFDNILPVIVVIMLLTVLGLLCGIFPALYYSSCREAEVFNEKYETDYTCGDFFWARSQINQQIQIIKLEGLTK